MGRMRRSRARVSHLRRVLHPHTVLRLEKAVSRSASKQSPLPIWVRACAFASLFHPPRSDSLLLQIRRFVVHVCDSDDEDVECFCCVQVSVHPWCSCVVSGPG